ncbi:MAG: lamin tail domain-containing protein, partial [Bacteroidota bacterium]|nr:lamin tail domain-containing protein [Bacteroidota bacterium]
KMNEFAYLREDYIRDHLMGWFGSGIISDTAWITLDVSNIAHGTVQISTIDINYRTLGVQTAPYPWEGKYFTDIPFDIIAKAKSGYLFDHWSDGDTSTLRTITLSIDTAFTAIFAIDSSNTSPGYNDLVINEFLASNVSDTIDNYGEYEDWIEFYNTSSDTIDMGGLFMSDDLSDPGKWQIPISSPDSTIIPPGGFKVFFADKDPEQGVLHLDFNLSSTGESIGLFHYNGTNFVAIDTLNYGLQLDDISYGRFADGSPNWYTMTTTTPGMPNDTTTIQTPVEIPELFINEFLADNDSDIVDNYAEHEDWIEIYNAGVNPVDIGGFYISDDFTDPALYQIPDTYPDSTTIAPGGFLVLWADKDEEQGILHVDFKLGAGGEQIILSKQSGGLTYIIDSLSFNQQNTDTTFGRFPDGSANWYLMGTTTAGLPNDTSSGFTPTPQPQLFINEFLASNNNDTVDNYQEYEDWIEIYNAGSTSVQLGGLFITDDLNIRNKWQIPVNQLDSTLITPGDFLVFFADEDTTQGVMHLNFKLSSNGESIGIYEYNGNNFVGIDSIDFGLQLADVSYGRFADGSPNWYTMTTTTPGMPNDTTTIQTPVEIPELYINEFLADNDSDIVDNYAEHEDWIEIYNAGVNPVDIGGFYIS